MNSPSINDAALKCLAHLEQEEALLTTAHDALHAIREKLVQGDLDGLAQALQNQDQSARPTEEISRARARMRQCVGQAIGVSANSATLSALVGRIDGVLRDRLLNQQRRLSTLANKVDLLNRGNAVLAKHSVDLLDQLLLRLTGNTSAGQYARSGRLEPASGGSVMQANL